MATTPVRGLPEVFDAARRRWRLAALIFLAALAGVGYYAQSLPKQYTGTAVVALSPRPNAGVSALDVPNLGQKYIAFVTADTTLDTEARVLGVSRTTLEHAVSASVPTGSVNLTISVQLRSARRAAAAANSLADQLVAFSADDKLLSAQTVSPAIVPTSPSKPRRKLIESAGGLVALVLAVLVAVLVERGRPRVRSPMEVAFVTGHGVIGRVPVSRAVKGGVERALADPMVGGAIRSLRTVVNQEARHSPIHVLAVTSSVPAEGKTTIASTLACAIAGLEARVLLIDTDLRNPGVHKVFNVSTQPGLVDVLRETTRFATAVRPIRHVPGLYVLPTSGAGDTGDLLARNLKQVLIDARDWFDIDVVVMDTPPLLAGDDSATVATHADAVLLVVAAGVQTARLGEAARILDTLGVRVLGALMNRSRMPKVSYPYRGGGSTNGAGDTT